MLCVQEKIQVGDLNSIQATKLMQNLQTDNRDSKQVMNITLLGRINDLETEYKASIASLTHPH